MTLKQHKTPDFGKRLANVVLTKYQIRMSQESSLIHSSFNIPTLGTKYSHAGNKIFPHWEQNIPSLGTITGNSCH